MKMINLSQREMQILNLIAFEFSTKEIAQKLFLSPNTIKTHRKNLFDKMGASNIAGLIRISFEFGIPINHFKLQNELCTINQTIN